jgi:hypothetical protein
LPVRGSSGNAQTAEFASPAQGPPLRVCLPSIKLNDTRDFSSEPCGIPKKLRGIVHNPSMLTIALGAAALVGLFATANSVDRCETQMIPVLKNDSSRPARGWRDEVRNRPTK